MVSKSKAEQYEQLVETLKFTPRTYKLSLYGYGGEKVMGTVSRSVWDYCMANSVDLQDIAWQDEDTVVEDLGLDLEMLPFPPGSWYECDNMAHVNGVSRNAGTMLVEDESGQTVVEQALDEFNDENSPNIEYGDEIYIGQRGPGEIVFVGNSNEKGTFFEAEIELTQPFDITKLTLVIDEVDGEEIVSSVLYNGEELSNWGGNTDGKSSDFTMCLVKEDGQWERYAPEEKDWGHPESGPSPDDWEQSPKFKFKQHKPVYTGYYSVNYGYGSTYSSLYWNGTEFGEWEYGKFNPVNQAGIVTWCGYSWDTGNWSNQPKEPPGFECKCGWVGSREQLVEDSEYNDHCPSCNSTDLDWIEYDPDTSKGRSNREKYLR